MPFARPPQRAYRHTIDDFIAWYCLEPRLAFNKSVVLRYRLHLDAQPLSASTIHVRLAAVRRLACEGAGCGLLGPELAEGIRRVKSAKMSVYGWGIGSPLSKEEPCSRLPTLTLFVVTERLRNTGTADGMWPAAL